MQPGHHAGQGAFFATAEEAQLGLVQADAGLEAGAQLRRPAEGGAETGDLGFGGVAFEEGGDQGFELGGAHPRNSSPMRSRKASRARLMRLFTVPMERPRSSAISS